MTIDEKLQHFYESSVEEARETAARELQEHGEKLHHILEEHKISRRQSAELDIKAETENVRREVNKALSTEQLTLKRGWTKKQNDLKEKLFAEVKNKLKEFMMTSQYEDYLCAKIKEAKDFAGEDQVFICLSAGDSAKLDSLMTRTGLPLEVSKENFMGGIRATIPSKNILIDNSFLEKYETMTKEFKFDGGFKHE